MEDTKRSFIKGDKNSQQEHERNKEKSLGRVRLFANPWAIVHQAPWSMEFSRQEYWSG